MAFVNPFSRVKSLDNHGFLRVSVKNFLELEGRPQQFYDAIIELQHIREGLIVAQQGGMIDSLAPAPDRYRDAIEWLQLNKSIDTGIAVSAIANYDDINDAIASSFGQYVQWFKTNYLTNQTFYQNIQIQIGSEKLDRLKSVELQADTLNDDFRESLRNAQTQLAEASDARVQALNTSLLSQFNAQTQTIADQKREAIDSIKQAQSLTIWHDAYERNIQLYQKKLEGDHWKPLEARNRLLNNFGYRFKHAVSSKISLIKSQGQWIKFDAATSKKELQFIWYTINRTIRFCLSSLWQSISYSVKRAFSAHGQRTFWFTLLGTVLIGQSLVFLSLLLHGALKDVPFSSIINVRSLSALASNEFVFAKVSIFLGIILVPSLGYAFASRNYRIYSNLLEQYRHRATVAQTLQGVLRNIEEGAENKDIRMSLTTVAAVAMFEMKNVGHLSKRDGDTMPVGEVLQAIIGK